MKIDTSHFKSYCCLLRQLHTMIEKGNDSEEADVLRDQMDFHWRRLSQDEITQVKQLSASLYKENDMTVTKNEFKSRWGFHPCDYSTYRKLKILHKWYHQTLCDYANWYRWRRKLPENRVMREYERDSQGRKCGVKSTCPRPEPEYCEFFVNKWGDVSDQGIIALYQKSRLPSEKPVDSFNNETLKNIDTWYNKANQFFNE